MATPPKQSGKWQSKWASTYGQICAAVNCNNYTGTCEGLSFFTFPKDEERYAHFIEFDRYATSPTSSICLSDNMNPACSARFCPARFCNSYSIVRLFVKIDNCLRIK